MKGFAVIDDSDHMHLLHTTSHRVLAQHQLAHGTKRVSAVSPRADLLLRATGGGQVHTYRLDNEHPEISLSALFAPTWYEGYAEPVLSWQSSSADNDFEPKFSLTPLLFGTIKPLSTHAVRAAPGNHGCPLHRLLHEPGHAQRGEAFDRNHGRITDGDPSDFWRVSGWHHSSKPASREYLLLSSCCHSLSSAPPGFFSSSPAPTARGSRAGTH